MTSRARQDETPDDETLDDTAAPEDGATDDDATDDDALPPPEDAYWDGITADTLRLLRQARSAHRRERLRATAYAVYVGFLVVLVYLLPYVLAALRAPDHPGRIDPDVAGRVLAAVLALVLTVVVALVRDAVWRGPALLDEATVAWVLPSPIRRGPLLRPRLVRTLVVAAAAGTLVGATGGAVVRLAVGGNVTALVAAGAVTGLLTAVAGVGLAGIVEASGGRGPLARAGTWLWLVPVLPAVLAIGAWAPAAPTSAPVLVALAGAGTLVAAAAATTAYRRIDGVPARVLRSRAASVSAVAASIWTVQPRRARLLIELAQGRTPRPGWRLPPPRRHWLLWPWRDATALLRSPSRLLWGLLWIVAAALLAVEGAARADDARRAVAAEAMATGAATGRLPADAFALAVLATLVAYLAASQLVEAARLDADDPRTVRSLPTRPMPIALAHLVTPLVVLVTALALTAVPVAIATDGGVAAVARLAAALPALAGAALVSAYRGDLPLSLLIGTPSPMGDTSPLQALAWFVRGPLVAMTLLLPLALEPSARTTVTVAAVAGAVMIGWAANRADHVLRSSSSS